MSDLEGLHITWRKPVSTSQSDARMPKALPTTLEVVEANFIVATRADEKIRAVFDINHTLGVFEHSHFAFYPGVLEELSELLTEMPVALISGDRLKVINQKLIPVLTDYVKSNYSEESQKKIFENLTIYAQTGMRYLKFCEKGLPDENQIPSAQLNATEYLLVKEQIIPIIHYEFSDDPRFKILSENGFDAPNTSVENANISSPLYAQLTPGESIELSIFGIHQGDDQKLLKNLLKTHPELCALRDEIIDKCCALLEHYTVNAQLGGTTTVDFRKFDKAEAVYRYLAGLDQWDGHLTIIGVGDSFGPKGNDQSFSKSCSLVFDVSENHKNAENALAIIRLIRKYSKIE